MTVEQLHLAPAAKQAAFAVRAQFPSVTFTSGRRDAYDQARVMAANVVRDRQWILRTYRNTPLRATLQRTVEEAPPNVEKKLLAYNLYEALLRVNAGDLVRLSRHLTGDAFDLAWPGQAVADQIIALLQTNAAWTVDKVLTREGDLQLIHAQFEPSVEV